MDKHKDRLWRIKFAGKTGVNFYKTDSATMIEKTHGKCECYELPDGRSYICAACRENNNYNEYMQEGEQ